MRCTRYWQGWPLSVWRAPPPPTGSRAFIGQAADYIRTHYAEELDLDKLLRIAPMSKSHFLRVFREQMGTTPYNFLLCTRMTQAKELLVMTDLSVGAVAAQVGFSSESSFPPGSPP